MYRRLHNQFGTAGMILSVVAIVLALAGGAIAANSGKPGPRGKTGKTGKTGPQGPAGTNGTNGTNGPEGKQGPEGKAGAEGTNGKSVALGTATAGECPGSNPSGGKTVEVEGSGVKKAVCNGKEGSPWTAGGTLPSEATETGSWEFSSGTTGVERTAISFTIPLAASLDPAHVAAVSEGGEEFNFETFEPNTPPACTGSAASPQANPGFLCVYVGEFEGILGGLIPSGITPPNDPVGLGGAGTTGAAMAAVSTSTSSVGAGTWAVTAE